MCRHVCILMWETHCFSPNCCPNHTATITPQQSHQRLGLNFTADTSNLDYSPSGESSRNLFVRWPCDCMSIGYGSSPCAGELTENGCGAGSAWGTKPQLPIWEWSWQYWTYRHIHMRMYTSTIINSYFTSLYISGTLSQLTRAPATFHGKSTRETLDHTEKSGEIGGSCVVPGCSALTRLLISGWVPHAVPKTVGLGIPASRFSDNLATIQACSSQENVKLVLLGWSSVLWRWLILLQVRLCVECPGFVGHALSSLRGEDTQVVIARVTSVASWWVNV